MSSSFINFYISFQKFFMNKVKMKRHIFACHVSENFLNQIEEYAKDKNFKIK